MHINLQTFAVFVKCNVKCLKTMQHKLNVHLVRIYECDLVCSRNGKAKGDTKILEYQNYNMKTPALPQTTGFR